MQSQKESMLPDIQSIRTKFPALQNVQQNNRPCIFFDAPGGTQVPRSVIEAMANYFQCQNANTHGRFHTSEETDRLIYAARQAMADFLGATSPQNIVFGQNMTTLTFHLSHALSNWLEPGDEIIVTRLDHDANISPWLALQRRGVRIKWVDFRPPECELCMEEFAANISSRTRLIATGYASNAVGTINPIRDIVRLARENNIFTFIDAVHYAPHGLIDVQDLDCDFLVCSAYKFFGPHVGIAYLKPAIAEQLAADKVRPQENHPPEKFETGTLNHEGLAGVIAAVEYLAELYHYYPKDDEKNPPASRREKLCAAMQGLRRYEIELSRTMLQGLQSIQNINIYGIASEDSLDRRTPTFAITAKNQNSADLAAALGERGMFVWDGDFYAMEVVNRLQLQNRGGLVRIGMVHYNTPEEIIEFLDALREIVV